MVCKKVLRFSTWASYWPLSNQLPLVCLSKRILLSDLSARNILLTDAVSVMANSLMRSSRVLFDLLKIRNKAARANTMTTMSIFRFFFML